MTDIELERWLDRADIVCLHSYDDPLYNVIFECMSHLSHEYSFLTREAAEYAIVVMTCDRESRGINGRVVTPPEATCYGYN